MKDKCDYMIQEFSKDFETCESDPRLAAFQVFTESYDESKAKVDKVVKENLEKRFESKYKHVVTFGEEYFKALEESQALKWSELLKKSKIFIKDTEGKMYSIDPKHIEFRVNQPKNVFES
jgi:hypothetical protein